MMGLFSMEVKLMMVDLDGEEMGSDASVVLSEMASLLLRFRNKMNMG